MSNVQHTKESKPKWLKLNRVSQKVFHLLISGIASTSINESKERVKSALLTSNYTFPPKRFVISLTPSAKSKEVISI